MSPWPGSYVQSLPSFSLLKAAYSALPWAREVLPEAPCTPGYRSNRELEEFLILLPLLKCAWFLLRRQNLLSEFKGFFCPSALGLKTSHLHTYFLLRSHWFEAKG